MTQAAAVKLDKKIVGYQVVTEEDKKAAAAPAPAPQAEAKPAMRMEDVPRPDVLRGQTYKMKSPIMESAMYITINDVGIEEGDKITWRPFEIFINSKDMKDFQWIVALTRVMSAVFRKGGDITFLVDELESVFNPSGGYFKKGGKYMPSLVAEIGEILKQHLVSLGMMEVEGLSPEAKAMIAEKRADLASRDAAAGGGEKATESGESFPAHATVCRKCNTKAVIRLDSCDTCLNCSDSKCG